MKVRKKPVIVDAWAWTGRSQSEARRFTEALGLPSWSVGQIKGKTGLIIPTLEGDHIAEQGDFVIRGVSGEYYPCKPYIFIKTYEVVEE